MPAIKSRTHVVFKINSITDEIHAEDDDGFSVELSDSKGDQWHVYVNEDNDSDGERYVSLSIETFEKKVFADVILDVYVLDSEYRAVDRVSVEGTVMRGDGTGPSKWLKYSTLMAQKDKYLPNNCLTIGLDVSVVKSGHSAAKKKRRFANSFNVKELNDCRFDVRGKQFFASKAMLCDESEVFHTMFTSDMSEKADNVVVIDDIQPEVFEEFLKYLYFGYSENVVAMAEDMRYVADKYMIPKLKKLCERLYYLRIDTRNAFQVLEVMNKWDKKYDIEWTLRYIKDNWNEVLETEWKRLVADDSHPIAKLIAELDPKSGYKPLKELQIMSYSRLTSD